MKFHLNRTVRVVKSEQNQGLATSDILYQDSSWQLQIGKFLLTALNNSRTVLLWKANKIKILEHPPLRP